MRANEGVSPRLRDSDIRIQLNLWLENKFAYDPTTVVYSELTIPRPSSRIDIAVANGVLAGFEIKSDLDSLSRLPRQIASFTRIFESLTLVTTATHLEKARILLPEFWGILLINDQGDLDIVKQAKTNKNVNGEHALYLLTCAELLNIIRLHRIVVPNRAVKSVLITKILKRMSLKVIMQNVRDALKIRSIPVDHQNPQAVADI